MFPFKEKGLAQSIKTFDWLEEALDDEEKEFFGKSGGDIEKFLNREMLCHSSSGTKVFMVNI